MFTWKTILVAFLVHCLWTDAPAWANEDRQVRVSIFPKAVFRPVWEEIIEEMGYTKIQIPMTIEARRQAFVAGDLDMDCCFHESWRQRPEEQEIQHFSDPITIATDHIIHRDGLTFEDFDPSELARWRIVVIKGFSYTHENHFGETVSADTIKGAFQMLHEGKGDLTITGQREFRKYQGAGELDIALGPVAEQIILKARIHKNRADLLPIVNAAIARLKSKGRIEELIARSIRNNEPD